MGKCICKQVNLFEDHKGNSLCETREGIFHSDRIKCHYVKPLTTITSAGPGGVVASINIGQPSTIIDTATKHDSDKPDLSLIPFVAMRELAKAMQVGEAKYGRYNYAKGHKASKLIAASLRHLAAWNDGEELDADGQHHLGSAMANCAMILRQQELGTHIDDRFKPETKEK